MDVLAKAGADPAAPAAKANYGKTAWDYARENTECVAVLENTECVAVLEAATR